MFPSIPECPPKLKLLNYNRKHLNNLCPKIKDDYIWTEEPFSPQEINPPVIYMDKKGFAYILLRVISSVVLPRYLYLTDEAGNIFWRNCYLFGGIPLYVNDCVLLLHSGPNDTNYWDYNMDITSIDEFSMPPGRELLGDGHIWKITNTRK